jgi:hypothetical protein
VACGVSVTQGIYDLLNEQLLSCEPDCQYPHVNANLTRGETMQLRASPFGEFYDVLHSDAPVRTTRLLRHFYIKTIILLRQARDNHRETSKQRRVFLRLKSLRSTRRCSLLATWSLLAAAAAGPGTSSSQ